MQIGKMAHFGSLFRGYILSKNGAALGGTARYRVNELASRIAAIGEARLVHAPRR
jgi:hypothetical protein